jgi:hypothetical protein
MYIKKGRDRVNDFSLAQDTYQWRVFVKVVMNIRAIYNKENY